MAFVKICIGLDAQGLHLAPGFVDIHVHLREPGFEYKETIRTGTMSAAAGGFTTVACMPNTKPAIDERSVVEYIIKQARQLNPELRVLVRCAYLREVAALGEAGADFVAAGEAEVGVVLTEAVVSLRNVKGDDAHRAAIRQQLYNSASS